MSPRIAAGAAALLLVLPALAQDYPLFHERRAAALARHDTNGDGRLEDAEREAMRQARKEAALKRPPRRGMFPVDPALLVEYDGDGDGELDDAEMTAMMEGIRRRWEAAQREYDRNGNGELEPEELGALQAAILKDEVKGIPKFMAQMGGRPRGRPPGRGGFGERTAAESPLDVARRFDADANGRLDEAELAAARAALAAHRNPQP